MKFRTTILLVLAIASTVAMASCTKNYTCHCEIKYSGSPGLPDSTVQEYSITDSKSGATSKCKAESDSVTNNGITSVEKCYIY